MAIRKENSTNSINKKMIIGRCPVSYTLELIGGRWKTLILYNLNTGTKRFSELKKLMPDVTEKMLIQQLRELEADKLVERKVYAEVPPRVEYSVTPLGSTLRPVLDNIAQWGLSTMQVSGRK